MSATGTMPSAPAITIAIAGGGPLAPAGQGPPLVRWFSGIDRAAERLVRWGIDSISVNPDAVDVTRGRSRQRSGG